MQNRLPPLGWLRTFEAAARHLSFTGAARDLNMTQSAVSQQIKSLEGHLGQPLFLRRPKALELTEAGITYLPVVREAFRTLGARHSSGHRCATKTRFRYSATSVLPSTGWPRACRHFGPNIPTFN